MGFIFPNDVHLIRIILINVLNTKKEEGCLSIPGITEEVKRETKNIFTNKLQKIILYGSYARDEATLDSDIDIMILIDENRDNLRQYRNLIIDVIFELSLKYDIILSILIKNYKDFNNYIEFVPFFRNVYNEGIEIYG